MRYAVASGVVALIGFVACGGDDSSGGSAGNGGSTADGSAGDTGSGAAGTGGAGGSGNGGTGSADGGAGTGGSSDAGSDADAGCGPLVPTWTAHPGLLGSNRFVHVADVDGDGDSDVITGSNAAIEWWENQGGSATTFAAHPIAVGATGALGLWAADVDGDTDMDVVAAVGGAIRFFENMDGLGTTWTNHVVRDPGGANYVFVADVNGDSDLDVVGSTGGTVLWMENASGDGSTWSEHTVASLLSPGSAQAADFDGDGAMDIAATSQGLDDVRVYLNADGVGTTWTPQTVDPDYDGVTVLDIGDMDGDGDSDLIAGASHLVYNWPENVSWWQNDGTGANWTYELVYPNPGVDIIYNTPEVKAVDIDGDGKMDVLGHHVEETSSLTPHEIRWWKDTGDPTWDAEIIADDFESLSIDAGDLDGDGDTDVVGASATDTVWWENKPVCPP